MTGFRLSLRPQHAYMLVLGVQFAILVIVLIPLGQGLMLFAGILLLISLVLRLRFSIEPGFMLIDCGLFCLASLVEPALARFLFVYAYYFAWQGSLLYALLPVGLSLYLLGSPHFILPIQALLIGVILQLWDGQSRRLYGEADLLRHRIYRMEQTELQLLSEHQDTARLSQLRERQRLAEQLHDNLGHELTAAHLSLKSTCALIEQGEVGKAGQALRKAEERLHAAIQQLKKAVSRLEPDGETGLRIITDLFDSFMYPVELERLGDPAELQAYHLQLLHGAVKEALTNIAKHAVPRRIRAVLDTSGSIIRITIENDGSKIGKQEPTGRGLRYLRRRLEAVHGSLSTSLDGTVFKIIIILPKEAR